ncbi:hypothetical protein PUW79_07945 [Microbacterium sp. NE2HP2]|uniref:hypothetical protein n=1 Tax=Microbacterium plantarum TaxID=1816425 RepID=UPI0023663554|nr:hypothetical protein [Microbacterium plantarum]MDD7944559.1 hypothetical protein [Microbacterium plantarum]
MRKLSNDSMWSVGAAGDMVRNDGYVVLPLQLGVDWAAGDQQAQAAGSQNISETGADPYFSLTVAFVSASGRSFTTMDDYSVSIDNEFSRIGVLFPPAESITTKVPVTVPSDQVDDGLWVVRNARGDSVFISAG